MPTDIEMAKPKLYKYFNTWGDFPSESSTPSRNDIMQWCMTSAEKKGNINFLDDSSQLIN